MGLWQSFQAAFPKDKFIQWDYDFAVAIYNETYRATVAALMAFRPDGGRAEFENRRTVKFEPEGPEYPPIAIPGYEPGYEERKPPTQGARTTIEEMNVEQTASQTALALLYAKVVEVSVRAGTPLYLEDTDKALSRGSHPLTKDELEDFAANGVVLIMTSESVLRKLPE